MTLFTGELVNRDNVDNDDSLDTELASSVGVETLTISDRTFVYVNGYSDRGVTAWAQV